ncbi:MAG: flagellar motor switch protein FliN [Treponema sp.]|nr:flagellar motor switch protein FliN [Treponema sp.]
MSDGALSQDEIDALLAGVDTAGSGPSPAGGSASSPSPDVIKAFQEFLAANTGAESSNLSMMTGATLTLGDPELSFTSRDELLEQLPETVTVVRADFNSGFPGEHLFVLPEDAAKSIASLMNKEEDIEMDEMAMSVIGEAISQLVGTQITDLTKKTNNKSIAAMAPEAVNVRKATAALPGGEFLSALFTLDMGDGTSHQMWEIYGGGVAQDIGRALNAPVPAAMPAMAMSGATPGGMQGMSMNAMQSMGGGGMSSMGNPTNVQSVQFPNLMPHTTPQEAGNINLIMDVYMEMTVELGRTRKLIKEILGMGEGTIIELDKLAGEPVDILVNHKLIAKGEVVVIDENFGVRVTEIVSPMERMNDLG